MLIEKKKISDLRAAPYNPRKISKEQMDRLIGSIQEFDVVEPVVWNKKTGNVVGGHQRLIALQAMGRTEVDVVVVDIKESKEKALNIALNKISGEWDFPKLKEVILEIDTGEFPIELTGFDYAELEKLIGYGQEIGLTEEDAVPAPPNDPITKAGDLWSLGSHRLICGDSTNFDDVKKLFGDVKPHLMVTDPPYGVEYDANWRNEADRANGKPYGASAVGKVNNDNRVDWQDAWKLFDGEVAYVWHAGIFAAEVAQSLKAVGFEIRSQIIWTKPRFAISRGHYHWQHEPCWYAVRKNGHWEGGRSQTTVWNIEHNKSETGHSTQKPVEAMRRPILNNSCPGQAVFDPFLGSGTTLIACETTHRVCYGLEIDPAYCDIIIERWQKFTGKKAEKVS